jgi:hypothetical protein
MTYQSHHNTWTILQSLEIAPQSNNLSNFTTINLSYKTKMGF